MQERDVPTQIWNDTYTQNMVKKVPYAEMRFFFCTHARLWGRPPRWQLPRGKLQVFFDQGSLLVPQHQELYYFIFLLSI